MKKEFRKKVLAERKTKDKDFIEKNSDIITEKLLQMDCIKNAQNIMLYLDFNNEVATDHLINKLISLRKTVTSPITIVEDRVLIPAQITDLENGIKVGAYNIREPKPDAPTLDVKDLDVVIVPAVAYSEDTCLRKTDCAEDCSIFYIYIPYRDNHTSHEIRAEPHGNP